MAPAFGYSPFSKSASARPRRSIAVDRSSGPDAGGGSPASGAADPGAGGGDPGAGGGDPGAGGVDPGAGGVDPVGWSSIAGDSTRLDLDVRQVHPGAIGPRAR